MVVTSIKDIHMEGGDKSKVKNTVALFEERVHATEADHVTRLHLVRYLLFMFCFLDVPDKRLLQS